MKIFIYIIFILFAGSKSFCQEKNIDSLINQLSNDSIIASGSDIGPNTMLVGSSVRDLLDLGKSATKKLVAVLDDSTKGIIAHYILTITWRLPIEIEKMIFNEKNWIYTVSWNRLNYFMDQKTKKVYANHRDLITNKWEWEIYLKDKTY